MIRLAAKKAGGIDVSALCIRMTLRSRVVHLRPWR
jgi:hypothetical protein